MAELSRQQASGTAPMIPANRHPEIMIPAAEKHLIHVLLDEDRWEKGKKLSKPYKQCFYVDDFVRMSETEVKDLGNGKKSFPENAFAGLKMDIIHDPRTAAVASKPDLKNNNPAVASKPYEEMEMEELKDIYLKLYESPASEEDTPAQLIELIKEKVVELEKTKKPAPRKTPPPAASRN